MKKFFLGFLFVFLAFLNSCSVKNDVDLSLPVEQLFSALKEEGFISNDNPSNPEENLYSVELLVTGDYSYEAKLQVSLEELNGKELVISDISVGSVINVELNVYAEGILLLKGKVNSYKVTNGENNIDLVISYQAGYIDGMIQPYGFVVESTNEKKDDGYVVSKKGFVYLAVAPTFDTNSDAEYEWVVGGVTVSTEPEFSIDINTVMNFPADLNDDFIVTCYCTYESYSCSIPVKIYKYTETNDEPQGEPTGDTRSIPDDDPNARIENDAKVE